MNIKYVRNVLVVILFLCNQIVISIASDTGTIDPNSLYSKSAVLLDADSKRVLYSKDGEDVLPMASTTKIMTCILALELADLDEVVEISPYAASQPKVKLFLKAGEQVRLGDLLYSLMLESHNDTAVAIAEHIGGKLMEDVALENINIRSFEESKQAVKSFAKLMNHKALELGCENTYYITPNGLDATETFTLENGTKIEKIHSTTATDLASVMAYCIMDSEKKDEFLEITQTPQYSFTTLDKTRSFLCSNHNAFLGMMEGALSGKTGYTGNASYCYVGALERDGKTFVVALLSCSTYGNQTKKWLDTKKLMNYGMERFELKEVYTKTHLDEIQVKGAVLPNHEYFGEMMTKLQVLDDNPIKILVSERDKVEVEINILQVLEAPIVAGTKVGSVSIMINDELYEKRDVVTTESIKERDYIEAFDYIVYHFLPIII